MFVRPFPQRMSLDGRRLVVAPTGDIDLASAGRLRNDLADALHDGWEDVVVDLRSVTFMDSQGVHALLDGLAAYWLAGCRLSLLDQPSPARRVLDLLDIRSEFPTASPLALDCLGHQEREAHSSLTP